MQNKMYMWIAIVGIAFSLATLAQGEAQPLVGCCSCACPPVGGAAGFDTCEDVAGPMGNTTCASMCDSMNCSVNFFQNGTMCSDPALASSCADANRSTMAPASSPIGLVALIAMLAGFGAFFVTRKRTA